MRKARHCVGTENRNAPSYLLCPGCREHIAHEEVFRREKTCVGYGKSRLGSWDLGCI